MDHPVLFFKGFAGSLFCTEPIPGITQEISKENQVFYGGKHFICESLTPGARDKIINLLNQEYAETQIQKITIELNLNAYVTLKHIESGYMVKIIPSKELRLEIESPEQLEKLPLREFEAALKKIASEKVFKDYGPEAEVQEVLLINKGNE